MQANSDRHMRQRLRLWYHAEALLEIILEGPPPADKQMERYFRNHRKMGKRDRGFVAETVYSCLRNLARLRYVAGHDAPYAALVAAELLMQGGEVSMLADARLTGGEGWSVKGLASRIGRLDTSAMPPAVRASMPEWLFARLAGQLGEDETLKLADALNQPAPLDLRVNLLKAEREQVRQLLAADGAELTPTPYSPWGLRCQQRASLFRTQAFADGLFEVQDEGSQLIALLVEAEKREMVTDFCAGGGGKTLALGMMMQAAGTLYACDVAERRLKALKPRLARAGLSSVRSLVLSSERDAHLKRLKGKMHRVLVDAPCSGTGTLRRNPDIKWRDIDLNELTGLQSRILDAAANLVRPGGRLVYATCSVLDTENGAIVRDFLATHADFELLPVAEILARHGIKLPGVDEMMQLFPHLHGTDGFFAAVLQRRS